MCTRSIFELNLMSVARPHRSQRDRSARRSERSLKCTAHNKRASPLHGPTMRFSGVQNHVRRSVTLLHATCLRPGHEVMMNKLAKSASHVQASVAFSAWVHNNFRFIGLAIMVATARNNSVRVACASLTVFSQAGCRLLRPKSSRTPLEICRALYLSSASAIKCLMSLGDTSARLSAVKICPCQALHCQCHPPSGLVGICISFSMISMLLSASVEWAPWANKTWQEIANVYDLLSPPYKIID